MTMRQAREGNGFLKIDFGWTFRREKWSALEDDFRTLIVSGEELPELWLTNSVNLGPPPEHNRVRYCSAQAGYPHAIMCRLNIDE
jgi:hypothetical protein